MTTPVVFWNLHQEKCSPVLTWDTHLLQAAFAGTLWPHPPDFDVSEGPDLPTAGAVVCVNGDHHAGDVDALNERLAGMDWAVVIVTSDEASIFPVGDVVLPDRSRLWVQCPDPRIEYPEGTRFFGEGYHSDTEPALRSIGAREPLVDVFFAGQVNHPRREEMWDAFDRLMESFDCVFTRSPGFTQGMSRVDYLTEMAEAKVAPCPGGLATPDSFRLYEALQAGCVPIVDALAGQEGSPDGYWQALYPQGMPFPVIYKWSEAEKYIEQILSDWPRLAAECSAWWLATKRALVWRLIDDVREVSG